MTNQSYLGEFEHLVILAILRLSPDAFGGSIRAEIMDQAGRRVSFGALYSALRRMESKGLILGEERSPLPEDASRPRRYFVVTEVGLEAVRRAQDRLSSMSAGLESVIRGG